MRLQILIEDMVSELGKENLGLFLFIDEFQGMAPDLMALLLSVQHRMGQCNLPFFIIGAGLSNLPGVLTRVRSYVERLFDYRTLGMLDDQATAEGFRKPAEQSGRHFTDDALRELVRLSRGYPYFIQAYGSATWNASDSAPSPSRRCTTACPRHGRHSTRDCTCPDGSVPARWAVTTWLPSAARK
ncbi:hypothetical protein [Bifidobacterium cuniculi]|uniref:Exopolyphosphatase n=2 Tax=Bifidobacterium cuniculi TaxID=1688 RepID=A0A087AYR5_9BIFI|nr:hypothetical protein [Bifidobacterium cuniculi]KFI63915.1 exopolyphosphatase [Bifidobacterium cuniculi]